MSKKKQYYFIYQEKMIVPGAILKVKSWKPSMIEAPVNEVVFEWYVPDMDLYVLRYTSTYGTKKIGMYGDEFKRIFIYPTNQMDKYVVRDHQIRMENNKLTFLKELKIDGMFFAWLWYIVLMAITFIFNGRIFYWIVISICFLIYRYGKLKEEGYK